MNFNIKFYSNNHQCWEVLPARQLFFAGFLGCMIELLYYKS